jgi:hypothetical protein
MMPESLDLMGGRRMVALRLPSNAHAMQLKAQSSADLTAAKVQYSPSNWSNYRLRLLFMSQAKKSTNLNFHS